MIISGQHFEDAGPESRARFPRALPCDAGSDLSDRKRSECDVARPQPEKDPLRPVRRYYYWAWPTERVAAQQVVDLRPDRVEKQRVPAK